MNGEWRIDVLCAECGAELVVRYLGRDERRPRALHAWRCEGCDRSGQYPPPEVLILAPPPQRFARRRESSAVRLRP